MGCDRSPIALDFRDHGVRALQLVRRNDSLHVTGAHRVRIDGTPASPAEREGRWIEAGRTLLREGRFRGRRAAVALGHDGFEARRIRIPTDQLDDMASIVTRELTDDAGDAGDLTIVPIPVADLFDQGQTKREFLCCAARAAALQERIRVTESIGLEPIAIDLDPCALVRPFAARSQHECCLHLDFEPARSSLTVVRAGTPILMKTTGVGSGRLAATLRERLLLDTAALRDLGTAQFVDQDELHLAIVTTLAVPLEALVLEIARAVRYCGTLFQGRAVTLLRCSGELADLPGLVPYLGSRVGVTAELADPFADVDAGPAAHDHHGASHYCTAMGLALREVA